MIIYKTEKLIFRITKTKPLKHPVKGYIYRDEYNEQIMQRTWWFLFIPIFTSEKFIKAEKL